MTRHQEMNFRRTATGGGAILILGVLLAGCATAATEEPAGNTMESEVVIAAGGGALGGAIRSGAQLAADKDDFTVEFLEGSSADSFAKLQAQAQAGQVEFDIMLINLRIFRAMQAQGLTAPLDLEKLPAASELDADLAFPTELGDPPEGVRAEFGLDVLAYNTEVLKTLGLDAPTSWTDLLSPEYASCTVLISPVSQANYLPLLNEAVGSGYSDIDATLAAMQPLKDDYVAIADNTAAALEYLQQGNACLAPNSSARVIEQMAAGAPLDYVIPDEGTSFLEGVYVIPAGAPHPTAAYATLNALISQEGQEFLRDEAFWSVPNLQVAQSEDDFASLVPLAADFAEIGAKEIPASAFADIDSWATKWTGVFAG